MTTACDLTLHRLVHADCTLGQALAAGLGALGQGATVIAETPAALLVGRSHDGTVIGPDATPLDLDGAFAARAFSTTGELRWRRAGERGRAALISEQQGLEAQGFGTLAPLQGLETYELDYLLWGPVHDAGNGWAAAGSGRTAAFSVPLAEATAGGRLMLRAREYLGVADDQGNTAVVEQRFVTIELDSEGMS